MLRATIILDYQNMHLTGWERFCPDRPLSESLIDPIKFGEILIDFRNRSAPTLAVVEQILIFRGLPSAEYDSKANSRNILQKEMWEKDSRVKVFHRALKYEFEKGRQASGRYIRKMEKGIDVMCALALIRSVNSPDCDLVILASHDTDLEPALEEARLIGTSTRIESCSWFNIQDKTKQSYLRPKAIRPIWNHKLGLIEFETSLDSRKYG